MQHSTSDGCPTMKTAPNQSVERMGASRSGQFQFVRHRRLAPTAHAHRWASHCESKRFHAKHIEVER